MSDGKKKVHRFLGDTDTILMENLFVYHPATNEEYYLLENDPAFQIPDDTMYYEASLDNSGKYVVVKWDMGKSNTFVVIDYQERKGVARYSGAYRDICLMGDEVWLSTPDGIQRLPFPLIQEIQPYRYVFWGEQGSGFRKT